MPVIYRPQSCESTCFSLGTVHDDCIMSAALIGIPEPPCMDGIIMSLAGGLNLIMSAKAAHMWHSC